MMVTGFTRHLSSVRLQSISHEQWTKRTLVLQGDGWNQKNVVPSHHYLWWEWWLWSSWYCSRWRRRRCFRFSSLQMLQQWCDRLDIDERDEMRWKHDNMHYTVMQTFNSGGRGGEWGKRIFQHFQASTSLLSLPPKNARALTNSILQKNN